MLSPSLLVLFLASRLSIPLNGFRVKGVFVGEPAKPVTAFNSIEWIPYPLSKAIMLVGEGGNLSIPLNGFLFQALRTPCLPNC